MAWNWLQTSQNTTVVLFCTHIFDLAAVRITMVSVESAFYSVSACIDTVIYCCLSSENFIAAVEFYSAGRTQTTLHQLSCQTEDTLQHICSNIKKNPTQKPAKYFPFFPEFWKIWRLSVGQRTVHCNSVSITTCSRTPPCTLSSLRPNCFDNNTQSELMVMSCPGAWRDSTHVV